MKLHFRFPCQVFSLPSPFTPQVFHNLLGAFHQRSTISSSQPRHLHFNALPVPKCQLWHTDCTGGSSSAGFLGWIPRELQQLRNGSSGDGAGRTQPHLGALPGNRRGIFGAPCSGAGQERLQQAHIPKKQKEKRKRAREKGLLTLPETQSHQKAIRTREAVTRRKVPDPFREKGKENMGH